MTDKRFNKYVLNGGKLFIIKSIDTIRDSETKVINTSDDSFLIHKDSKRFYYRFEPYDEITDSLLIEYLIDRIDKYIENCEDEIIRNKNLLAEIKIKNNTK